MKKFILTAAIAAFGLSTAVAQDGFQGKSFIMGSAGMSTSKVGESKDKTTNFNISPVVGYFVAPTTAVALAVGYSNGKVETAGVDIKTNNFSIMPLVRQYFAIGSEKVFLFGQLAVPIAFGDTKVGGSKKVKHTDFGVALAPGIDVFLTGHWTVEATFGSIGYNNHKVKGSKADNNFNLGVDFSNIQLGLKYVF